MDDDVFPRADCLEKLLAESGRADIGVLAPRRLLEGKVFTNDFQEYNLTNPFSSMYGRKLAKQVVTAPVEIKGTAFEGPLSYTVKQLRKWDFLIANFLYFAMIRTTVCALCVQALRLYTFLQP